MDICFIVENVVDLLTSRGVDISVSEFHIIPESKEFKKLEERIVKKSLDIIVLKLINQKPMSGYSLILCIYKKFGVKLSAGTVYCLLRSLEKKGLLEVHSKKTRRYTLSKKGERTLRIIGNMGFGSKSVASSDCPD